MNGKTYRDKNKITNQVMDYEYLREQLDSLVDYKSSALHWNLSQLENSLPVIKKGKLFLIEKKHSKNALVPSMSDIKDGIIKMILFTNLAETKIGDKSFNNFSVLGLTSSMFRGYCHNYMTTKDISNCLEENDFLSKQKKNILAVFNEGKQNNFMVFLMDSNHPGYQSEILDAVSPHL